MTIKGITKRWIAYSVFFSIITLSIIIIGFISLIKNYFYNGIEQNILGKSEEISNILRGYKWQSSGSFNNTAREYTENFYDKKNIQVTVFDNHENIIASSTGIPSYQDIDKMSDYSRTLSPKNNYGVWIDRSSTGENIISLTKCVYSQSGRQLGAIRYTTSLKTADFKIFLSAVFLVIIGILISIFIICLGISFIESIISPVKEIVCTAKLIAHGDFNSKISKKYDDEMGELCDTINYMADELKTTERLKNDFISSVSHELRTPLTAIKGWAETMQLGDEIDKSTMSRGLDIIVHETERLSGIVEELLDFSRIQSGRILMNNDKIDVLAELGEAVYMFKDRAKSENKSLIYNEPKTISPILGDKNRLRQVFINIIDNSLKYTSMNGGISVSVSEKDSRILISVTDNGCGISKNHLPKITEKFYKANSTQRGSGIGLAIVEEIIRLHSGTLEILSEEGLGTTVNIAFPSYIEREI